jgi:transposase
MHYIGLDVHKKTIAYCVKTQEGHLLSRGEVRSTRAALTEWVSRLPQPWTGALEATLFTGWIYDALLPHSASLKVAHPALLRAIAASKHKNDRLDAEKICDLLRCDLLPECYMAPEPIRELRSVLRYRNLVVRQAVQVKNKISGLLMETGQEYAKDKLHRKRYFTQLLTELEDAPGSAVRLLKLSRTRWEQLSQLERQLLRGLAHEPLLKQRIQHLQKIPGVGVVLALTWALEVGEPSRFRSIAHAISYCGLCAAQRQSAGKDQRGPLSKQRNKHLQTVLVEVAHLTPRWNETAAAVSERERQRGHSNRAVLAVARKLVAWLLAADREFHAGLGTETKEQTEKEPKKTQTRARCA